MRTKDFSILLAAVGISALSGFMARAATVTATLDPTEISPGDSAQLTVTVSGGQDQVERPSVDGLEITPVGQSTQIEVINGSMTANASSTYAVTPQHEGVFVIPAIHAGNAASQPITLRVGSGSTASPTVPSTPAPGTGPVVMPVPQNSASSNRVPAGAEKYGSMEMTIPKKEFYEGEVVPVDIKVFVPDDVQATVTDLPQFTCEGFTLNSLKNGNRSEEVINGRVYNVLIWHSALTAVKTGSYPLSLQTPMSVVVMQRMARPDSGSMFDDFFRNAMTSFGTRKNITLTFKSTTLSVLPLPEAGRPNNFSGAIGQFEVAASVTPTSVNAGDPVTLRMKITGAGNFDRVSSEVLSSMSTWKTYSPKSSFVAADGSGSQGTKTFEQAAIPSDSSVTSVPSLSFSFFDPEKRQYVTRTTAPIPVSVSGTPQPVASATPSSDATTPLPAPRTPQPPTSDLRPNRIESGAFASTLRPIYSNPLFLAGQSLPLLGLVSVLLLVRNRRQAAHPERTLAAATQRAIREQIAAMDAAMHDRQAGPFFVHARSALQQRFGQRWGVRPETITVNDVESHLGTAGANVKTIFDLADQARYSDLVLAEADLQLWRQVVTDELAEKSR